MVSDVVDAFVSQLNKNICRHCPSILEVSDISIEDVLAGVDEPCPLRTLAVIGDLSYLEECIEYVVDTNTILSQLSFIYYKCSPVSDAVSSLAYACCVTGVLPLKHFTPSIRIINVFLCVPVQYGREDRQSTHRIDIDLSFSNFLNSSIQFLPSIRGSTI